MLDILHFIFSSFWVWAGATVMLSIVASCLGSVWGSVLSVISMIGGRRG